MIQKNPFRRLFKSSRGKRGSSSRALILLYHRVADLETDPQALCVSPARFDRQMQALRACASVMSLAALARGLREDRLGDRAVAITFDDGYYDNLAHAKGVLERHQIPATVFVTSGRIGTRQEFWWDELERLLLLPGQLPHDLELRLGQTRFQWEPNGASNYSLVEFQQHRDWSVLSSSDPTPRHALYRSLCDRLRPLPTESQNNALDQLRSCSGQSPTGRDSHRALTRDELKELANGGLIEVGGHTVTHPVLSKLPRRSQQTEIVEGKNQLEAILGQAVTSFSYPFGTRGDYDRRTLRIVRRAGFDHACANEHGRVASRSDPFQLKRCLVRNWQEDKFIDQIEEWFCA